MDTERKLVPLWPADARIARRGPLDADVSTEVCVVGAGIAGLTIAYRLARAGTRVVVLEAGSIGGGETERTTAHLALALDDGYLELERIHGEDGARLAAASHAAAIDEIERIVDEEGIECGFERLDGYLFAPPESPGEGLDEELAASRRAGIVGVARVERAPLEGFDTGPALRYPRQAQFHPLLYLAALAKAVERLGGRIHGDSRVTEVKEGSPARIRVGKRVVTAGAVVIATNTPFNDRLVIHTKQASYRTYAIAAPIPRGSIAPGLYWDTEHPYHYARLEPGSARTTATLIIGGEDHKTGQMEQDPYRRFARLERWSRSRFAAMGPVSYRWSGQVVGTVDGLAFIGRNPGDGPNVYISTGDCGHGMTYGTIAGLMLPDLIAGKHHPWEALYEPGRVRTGAAKRWARENLNAAAQYVRHVLPGGASSPDQIAPGSGAVLRRGLSKVAIYREPDGTLRELSAVCPHLGSLVCWNSAEKSWDCPAHGSRFAPDGRVLNGPANVGLAPAAAPKRRNARRRRTAAPVRGRKAARRGGRRGINAAR
ncbi:MAG: FAD-dependent oxidoreductase [Elusimicrobia bacterium]|nr:FAD-dependent oxidoreductase [Elusimicrobiota bacterium]